MKTTTYADMVNAALTATQKQYVNHGGNPAEHWSLGIAGETASCGRTGSGWRLNMPALPLDAVLTPSEVEDVVAYTIHEPCHPVDTNYQVWNHAVSEGLADLVNALEDVRIEARAIERRRTVNFKPVMEAWLERKMRDALAKGYDPTRKDCITWTLAAYGRTQCNGYACPSAPTLDAATAKAFAWIWRDLAKCQSTQDVLKLARKIAANPPVNGQGSGQGQQGSQTGQPGSGQGGQQGQGEGEDSGKGGQQGEGEGQDSGQDDANGTGGNGAGKGTDWSSFKPNFDLGDVVDRVSRRTGSAPSIDRSVSQAMTTKPNVKTLADILQTPESQLDPTRIRSMISNTARLQADLTKLVKSPERVGWTRNMAAGRFDRKAFTRAAAGARDVFARRWYEDGVQAAVAIVLDASGSMAGFEADCASAMAMAMGDALDRAKVPFEISWAADGLTNCDVIFAKQYAERWSQVKRRLSIGLSYGGTSNLPNVWAACERIRGQRDVTRRLVFVLADGGDNFPGTAMRRACDIWDKRGVEMIGVGLGYDVTDQFKHSITVKSAQQLVTEGFGILARTLKPKPMVA